MSWGNTYYPLPGEGDEEPLAVVGGDSAASYGGSGNGVGSSALPYVYFYPIVEGSGSASIDNLLSRYKWGISLGGSAYLTVSYSVLGISAYGYSGSDALGATTFGVDQIAGARAVMKKWSAVANLTFAEVIDSGALAGDIRWGQTTDINTPTAHAYYPGSAASAGDIWFGPNYAQEYGRPTAGRYGYLTYLHELGHALGLAHPHDGETPPVSGEDQLKYSVMSYRDYAGDSLGGYASGYFPTTPMLNDIAAIQWLYGANTSYRTGDDTYSWAPGAKVYETIWDAGGNDTVDASNQTDSVVLRLTSGQWSSIGSTFWNGQAYVRDTLTIAYNAIIENAIGSAGDDRLEGNPVANLLSGGAGNDLLVGADGNDTLIGGAGNDVLDGGTGLDLADYRNAPGAITLNLASRTASAGDGVDELRSIENAIGSAFNDLLRGDASDNYLSGHDGSDTLIGGAGRDTLDGGTGVDVADYLNAPGPVTVNLGTGIASGADGDDVLAGIENLVGSPYADVLIGGPGANLLNGGGGNDTLVGGTGSDTFVLNSPGLTTINDLAVGDGGDLIDLSLLLGRFPGYTAGQNPFVAGYLRLVPRGTDTALQIDENGRAGGATWAGASTLKGISPAAVGSGNIVGNHAPVIGRLIGDLDGNGRTDVFWRNSVDGRNAVWNGASSGSALPTGSVSDLNWKIAGIGDFNGDGKDDLLWYNASTGAMAAWNGGDNASSIGVSGVTDLNWRVAGIGDFNGDFKDDILWRHNATGSNAIWNGGNSGAGLPIGGVADVAWRVAGVGDFNGDGKDDIFWRNASNGSNAIWNGGNNATGIGISAVPDSAWKVAGVGDFNGDGRDDVLWRHSDTGANVAWNGANSGTPIAISPQADFRELVAGVGDYDGDGKDDILWRDNAGANVVWHGGQAQSALTVTTVGSAWATFNASTSEAVSTAAIRDVAADFNGDGRSDVLWRHAETSANAVWSGGNGDRILPVGSVTDQAWKIAGLGDLNGDGKDDIVWRNGVTGSNAAWNGGSSGNGLPIGSVADLGWKIAAVADFNADGRDDILWRHAASGFNAIWNGGSNSAGLPIGAVADINWKVAGVGDFDGNGQADILWRHTGNGANAIWGAGNSGSGIGVSAVADLSWKVAGIGDFNGDGKDDILWRNAGSGNNVIWNGAGSATTIPVSAREGAAWSVAGTGDYDADGKADILWRNSATGANELWLGGNASSSVTIQGTDSAWVIGVQTGANLLSDGTYLV